MQESFWEHNPSKKEIEKLFGKLKKEEIEKRLGPPPHYAHIVDLYYLRGQVESRESKRVSKKNGFNLGLVYC